MVLSNKKLKQKLREVKAESLTTEARIQPNAEESNGQYSQHPDDKSTSGLEKILHAARQRQRLSRRDKRRKMKELDGKEENPCREIRQESEKVGESKEREVKEESLLSCDGEKKKREREERDIEEKGLEEDKQKSKKKKAKKKKSSNTKKSKVNGVEEEAVMQDNYDSQVAEDTTTKVYVGGIPFYSTEDDIRSYFESCGTIREVDCMKFPDSGKFRGIAIISFKTEAAAKRALDLDGADMGGFYLKTQPYKTTRASNKVSDFKPHVIEGYNRIYVGNLSWDITEEELKHFFSDCSISSIRFGLDKETGEFRGYAHIDFADTLSLVMALKLDQQLLCGRPVKISCAVPKQGVKTPVASQRPPEPTNNKPLDNEVAHNQPISNHDNINSESIATNGKIRRRTCYECGKKGHLYSACPNKQISDAINQNTN